MSCPDFRKNLERYDINLFQETHLRPQQHDTIEVPQGYSLLSRTRKPKPSFDKSWGGTAVLIRSGILHKYREDFSGPDFIVVQINKHLVYNAYVLPESSQYAGVLEKDPEEALAASLALAYSAGFTVSLHGDLNARTASKVAYPLDPPRDSMDKAPSSPRGNWLCNMLGDYGLAFAKTRDTMRRTVIDYVACSRRNFSDISSFTVCDPVPGFDHAATVLRLKLDVDIQNILYASPRKKRRFDFSLPDVTDLDKLFIATLEAGKASAKKLAALGALKVKLRRTLFRFFRRTLLVR
ncbi:hypothetical protein FB451DRAFT_1411806 [Mycena latifolia]|nr:hypothetical protein FB451DRAFT_1411806 [Mycena latifolia]